MDSNMIWSCSFASVKSCNFVKSFSHIDWTCVSYSIFVFWAFSRPIWSNYIVSSLNFSFISNSYSFFPIYLRYSFNPSCFFALVRVVYSSSCVRASSDRSFMLQYVDANSSLAVALLASLDRRKKINIHLLSSNASGWILGKPENCIFNLALYFFLTLRSRCWPTRTTMFTMLINFKTYSKKRKLAFRNLCPKDSGKSIKNLSICVSRVDFVEYYSLHKVDWGRSHRKWRNWTV